MWNARERLLDMLASAPVWLWPRDCWPAMRFDGALRMATGGGHGLIRYTVEVYEPGQVICFWPGAPLSRIPPALLFGQGG